MSDCDPNSDEAKVQVDCYCHRVYNIKIAGGKFYSKAYKRSLFLAVKALDLRWVRRVDVSKIWNNLKRPAWHKQDSFCLFLHQAEWVLTCLM
jgi:hypothetical protein